MQGARKMQGARNMPNSATANTLDSTNLEKKQLIQSLDKQRI